MWLRKGRNPFRPAKVHVKPKALKRDYDILKATLPVPLGIDHLDEETLQKNPILRKMDLLNVGVLRDVELKEDRIEITDAEITNPAIKALYDAGELPYFSPISKMFTKPCMTGQADFVEDYSVIKRVDFVEKGACTQCTTGMASDSNFNAKAIIGDDILPEDGSNPGEQGTNPDGEGEGESEPTMADVMGTLEKINASMERQNTALIAIEGKLGIKEATPPGGDGQTQQQGAAASQAGEGEGEGRTGQASESDQRITALEQEIEAQKAKAATAEAAGIVNGYLEAGKIKPADTEKHIAMAKASPANYKAVMDGAPVIIDMERHSTGGDGQAGSSGNTLVDETGEEIDLIKSNEEIDKIIKKEEGGD